MPGNHPSDIAKDILELKFDRGSSSRQYIKMTAVIPVDIKKEVKDVEICIIRDQIGDYYVKVTTFPNE
jgi:hypothetical protein